MNLLIDTSTQSLILILFNNHDVIDYHFEIVSKDHASKLLPNIDALLKRNNLVNKDLQTIYVAEGPGSYTGVRIGVTVAKVLSYSLQIPLYSISSLKVIAASYLNDAEYLVPLIDARRGNVFSCLYQVKDNQLKTILTENLYSLQELIQEIETLGIHNVMCVGLDSNKFIDLLENKKVKSNLMDDFNPNLIVNLDFKKVENIHGFVPNYKRLSEAERNLL